MKTFIFVQYKLYQSGQDSIGIDKITDLANRFLTDEERADLFNGGQE
jgi:hypothetical protein